VIEYLRRSIKRAHEDMLFPIQRCAQGYVLWCVGKIEDAIGGGQRAEALRLFGHALQGHNNAGGDVVVVDFYKMYSVGRMEEILEHDHPGLYGVEERRGEAVKLLLEALDAETGNAPVTRASSPRTAAMPVTRPSSPRTAAANAYAMMPVTRPSSPRTAAYNAYNHGRH
jgi:hypothetical protein